MINAEGTMPTTEEYKKTYMDDGFVIVRDLFRGADLEQLSKELDELKSRVSAFGNASSRKSSPKGK